jgi:hypothetical protein
VKDLEIRNHTNKVQIKQQQMPRQDKETNQNETNKTGKRKTKQEQVRIVTTNVHGFQIEKTRKLNHILNWMETEDIHIMMVQENNTNMRHNIAEQIIQEELNNRTNIKMMYSQTQYETTTTYKPGETSIWIRNI